MKPISAIKKGRELEDFIAERLRLTGLDPRAYRQKGSGSGIWKGDSWNALDLHIEAKNWAKPAILKWLKQARKDNVSGFPEVIVWHPPGTSLDKSLVIIEWGHFEELLLGNKEQPVELMDKGKVKYKARRAVEAVKDLIRELDHVE